MCYKCHTGKPPGRQLLARSLGDVDAQEQKEGHMMQQQDHMQQRMSHGSDGGVAEGREYGASAVRGLLNFGHAVFATASRDTSKSYVPADFKFSIMPTAAEVKGKAAKRNCTECYGCSTQIEPLKGGMTKIMGQNMQIEVGASPEWLFFAGMRITVAATLSQALPGDYAGLLFRLARTHCLHAWGRDTGLLAAGGTGQEAHTVGPLALLLAAVAPCVQPIAARRPAPHAQHARH